MRKMQSLHSQGSSRPQRGERTGREGEDSGAGGARLGTPVSVGADGKQTCPRPRPEEAEPCPQTTEGLEGRREISRRPSCSNKASRAEPGKLLKINTAIQSKGKASAGELREARTSPDIILKPFGTCLSLRRLNDNSGRPAERGKDQTENSSDVPTQGFYKRTKLAFHLPAKASVVPRKPQRPPDTGSFQSLNTVTS